jgi:hypothetical protein
VRRKPELPDGCWLPLVVLTRDLVTWTRDLRDVEPYDVEDVPGFCAALQQFVATGHRVLTADNGGPS